MASHGHKLEQNAAPMTLESFRDLEQSSLTGALLALWFDGRGDWERAHETAQALDGPDGAWVHAYLHRKEGDTVNAAYWYRRAGRRPANGALQDEWESMTRELLSRR